MSLKVLRALPVGLRRAHAAVADHPAQYALRVCGGLVLPGFPVAGTTCGMRERSGYNASYRLRCVPRRISLEFQPDKDASADNGQDEGGDGGKALVANR
jgi:hypothetical protein